MMEWEETSEAVHRLPGISLTTEENTGKPRQEADGSTLIGLTMSSHQYHCECYSACWFFHVRYWLQDKAFGIFYVLCVYLFVCVCVCLCVCVCVCVMGESPGNVSEEPVTQEKRKKGLEKEL